MFWAGIFGLGVGLNILLGWHGWAAVLAGSLNDPDSYMRLERILQGVAHGHLVNMVARDQSGASVLVEWSDLLDMLIWLLAAPFVVFLGWPQALFVAGVALGPLSAGLLALSLAFATEPFAARRFLWLLPFCSALLPALANYAAPGIVTHHILLLALIALTAGGVARAWEGNIGAAFSAGIAGGFSVWLTPETMPFILLCYGALLLRWLERRIGTAMAACGAGFFDVLGVAFFIDPPQGGYVVAEADRLSLVYLVLGLAVLMAGLALWQVELRLPGRRRRAGIAAVAVLLLLWLALFPKVLLGPYGLIAPADARLFFGHIVEMQAARADAASFAYLWPGALALLIGIIGWAGFRSWRWGYIFGAVLVAFLLGVAFLRFAPVSAAAAAILVTVALQRLSVRFYHRPAVAASGRIALVVLLLAVPRLPAIALAHRDKAATAANPAACSLRHIGAELAAAGTQIVLADVNATPELLWRSHIETVGSLYHHGVAGFLRLRAAWRSTSDAQEPAEVAATRAQYVLFCAQDLGRTDLVADLPKTTLWDVLQAGHPPAWLTLIDNDPVTGWQLFQIRH